MPLAASGFRLSASGFWLGPRIRESLARATSRQEPGASSQSSASTRILATVTLKVYDAETPVAAFILAHGAGAGQQSSFMVEAARGLASRGIATATFDFPYITA